ncbi:MAG: hypothetical protein IT368_11800 [Candidatus Hydrogenedentes bacterium]|nr:hypothetical protein [Candidatus Hydrogenedentota bacterium]
MNKWGVLGFVFGVLCIVVVAGILFLASRDVAVAPPPVSNVQMPEGDEAGDLDATEAPAAPAVPSTPPAATSSGVDPGLRMTRTATNYASGQPVDVTVTLERAGSGDIRALGITETIPKGWTFEGVVSETRPDINRPVDNRIEFAWFKIPEFPITFTYRVKAEGTTGPQPIEGEALWRTDGPELRTGTIMTAVEPGTPSVASTPIAAPSTPAAANQSPLAVRPSEFGAASDVGAPIDVEVVVEEGAPAAAATPAPNAPSAPVSKPDPAALKIPVVVEEQAAPAPEAAPATETPQPEAASPAAADAGAAVPAAAASTPQNETGGITLTREVAGNAYTPGQPLTVQLTLTHEGKEPVTALAITEELPKNWAFASIAGGQAPTVAPPQRATGTLNFIWVNVPQFPFTVSYLIDTTENPGGPQALKGQAIYRKLGPELRSDEVVSELSPVAAGAPEQAAPVEVVVEDGAA